MSKLIGRTDFLMIFQAGFVLCLAAGPSFALARTTVLLCEFFINRTCEESGTVDID